MSNLLRIREALNSPSIIDISCEWMPLGGGESPGILIYGDDLSLKILKSEHIFPANLVNYYLQVLKLSEGAFPNIERLFLYAPVFLSGDSHVEARKIFAKKYKEIEKDLSRWLPQFTNEYLLKLNNIDCENPNKLIAGFLNGVFKKIIARALMVEEQDIPLLPEKFFTIFPDKKQLIRIENALEKLREFFVEKITATGGEVSEAQILLSLHIFGIEPLESALLYGMLKPSQNQRIWEPKELFQKATPVNFFSRVVKNDFEIDNLKLKKNQEIYFCPSISHQYRSKLHSCQYASYAFGIGSHVCLGKNISYEVAYHFFEGIDRCNISISQRNFLAKFERDNINMRVRIEKRGNLDETK